jgi:type IV pilus assembly protein PilE
VNYLKPDLNKRLKAYTLSEILVVLIIIGILAFLALPYLMSVVTRAKSTEAKLQLEHLQTLEKR